MLARPQRSATSRLSCCGAAPPNRCIGRPRAAARPSLPHGAGWTLALPDHGLRADSICPWTDGMLLPLLLVPVVTQLLLLLRLLLVPCAMQLLLLLQVPIAMQLLMLRLAPC